MTEPSLNVLTLPNILVTQGCWICIQTPTYSGPVPAMVTFRVLGHQYLSGEVVLEQPKKILESSGGRLAAVAAVSSATLEASCADWDRELADESVDDPVLSAVPTLLLSGTYDPITPPEYAEHAAAGLVNATIVVQDGRGHGIWFGSDCIAQLVQLFVEDPARTLDTSCADPGEPIEWARP